jgi:hypothetical protein
MKFCEDIKGLLLSNTAIASVWVNEDATVWHTSERECFDEVSRETILGSETAKAPKAPKAPKEKKPYPTEEIPVIKAETEAGDNLEIEEINLNQD